MAHSQAVFAADRLTSRAIDLAYLPSDSIFLSFLYEAGGIADMPEAGDSLTLSFWAPGEEKWYSIWQATGEADKRIPHSDNSRYRPEVPADRIPVQVHRVCLSGRSDLRALAGRKRRPVEP